MREMRNKELVVGIGLVAFGTVNAQQFVAKSIYMDTSSQSSVIKLVITDSTYHYYKDSAAARPDSSIYFGVDNNWNLRPTTKYYYDWNSNNIMIRRIGYVYDANTSTWRLNSKDTIFIGSSSLTDSIYSFRWNASLSKWDTSGKEVFIYTNGLVDSSVYFGYSNGSFQVSGYYRYYYQNGMVSQEIYCYFNPNLTCDTTDYDYYLDNNGRLDSMVMTQGNFSLVFKVVEWETTEDYLCNEPIVNVVELPRPNPFASFAQFPFASEIKRVEVTFPGNPNYVMELSFDLVKQWDKWRKESETFIERMGTTIQGYDERYYYFYSPTFTNVERVSSTTPYARVYVRQSTILVELKQDVEAVYLRDVSGRVISVQQNPTAIVEFYVPTSGVYFLTVAGADGTSSTVKVLVQ